MEKIKLLNIPITLDISNHICTNISFYLFEEYTKYIQTNDIQSAINVLYNIYDKGYSVMDILDNYFLFIKTTNDLEENEKYNIISVICKYITIFHNIHEHEIELALFTNNVSKIVHSQKNA
jgi:hypothetical protein